MPSAWGTAWGTAWGNAWGTLTGGGGGGTPLSTGLPGLAEVKAYLRVQTTLEDAVLTMLLARAQAAVETYLGVRLTAATDSMIDHTEFATRAWYGIRALQCVRYPLATSPAPVVEDAEGNVVDPATYTVEGRSGRLLAKTGISFDNGPYTITGSVGLSAHPDFATRIAPLVGHAILDTAADLYQRRNPGAVMEGESGVSSQYHADVIPPRTQQYLSALRVVGFA